LAYVLHPFWVWNAALNQLYMSSYYLAPDLIPYYFDALKRYRINCVFKVIDMEKDEVLANLNYFTQWGGRAWAHLCRHAIQYLDDLHGKTLLEIGPHYGRMSVCFALLGAKVIGIETSAADLKEAEAEARRWGVEANVSFVHYDGDLDHCQALNELEFDVIFTKSVLVLFGDSLFGYLQKLDRKLKTSGRCVFLENRYGGMICSALRKGQAILRGEKPHTSLAPAQIRLINQVFHILMVKRTMIPPIYLIMAQKKIYF